MLWMVYAKADKRWAGVDLAVVSLELLTVFFDGPLAVYVCYCLAKKDPKVSIWMIILATCELYGGKLHQHHALWGLSYANREKLRLYDFLSRVACWEPQP
jgi:hypothetical protein